MAFNEEQKRIVFDKAGGKCKVCKQKLVFENRKEGEYGAWDAYNKVSIGGIDYPYSGEALCLQHYKETLAKK